MQITARLVREPLKELSGQPKTKRGRHILPLFKARNFIRHLVQPTPNEVGPTAEIDDTSRQTFIHGNIRLALQCSLRRAVCNRIFWSKRKSIPANPLLIP